MKHITQMTAGPKRAEDASVSAILTLINQSRALRCKRRRHHNRPVIRVDVVAESRGFKQMFKLDAWTKVALPALAIAAFLVGCPNSPRPVDTTDPAVFAGDGAEVDYCVIPELDGEGPTADEIPKAYTPGDGLERWPMPVLADCREPLPPDAADLRGLWLYETHVERIEQCGNRVVIVGEGVLHDMRTDGTLANGVDDISVSNGRRINVSATWEDGSLTLKLWGIIDGAVRTRIDDDTILLTHHALGTVYGTRVCYVP